MVETTKCCSDKTCEQTKTDLPDVIGHRVEQRGKLGSIRFIGKLINNPKAGEDLWLGIEWDEAGAGKHMGTVDGVKYFEC